MNNKLMLRQKTQLRVTTKLRSLRVVWVFALSTAVAASLFVLSNLGPSERLLAAIGSNMGFESDLTEWSSLSGSWSINSSASYVRTGTKSVKISLSNGGTAEIKNDLCTFATTGSQKIFVSAWAKASNTNGRMRVGILNPITGQKVYQSSTFTELNSMTFTRAFAVLTVTSGVSYIPIIETKADGGSTSIYVDDVLMYTSTQGSDDTTEPAAPSRVTATAAGSAITLNWQNGIDAGVGLDGVMILRQANVQTSNCAVNNQAFYHTTLPAIGPSNINGWEVIYTGPTISSYVDNLLLTGNYTYLIYNFDRARNYNSAGNAARIIVCNSTSATISGSASVDGLYIPSNCTLTVTSAATVSIRNNALINVFGTIVNVGNLLNTDGGTVNMKSGSIYNYNRDGSSSGNPVLKANWEAGSKCMITGIDQKAPNGLDQVFHDFEWNCPSQSSNVNIPVEFSANGDVRITESATGNSQKYLMFAGETFIKGNFYSGVRAEVRFNAQNSDVVLNGTSPQTIQFVANNNNAFTKLTIQNSNGVTVLQNISLTKSAVFKSGSLNLNGYTFTLANNSNLICEGGKITNGTLNVPGGSRYNLEYKASGTTAVELTNSTAALNDLTINIPSGQVTLDKTANVNGTLRLTAGRLITGSNEVFVRNGAQNSVVYPASAINNSYVQGFLRRSIGSGSSQFDFPVGSSAYAQNIELKFNSIVGVNNVVVSFSSTLAGTQPNPALCVGNNIGINTLYNVGYWIINPDNQPTGGSYNIRIKSKGGSNPPSSPVHANVIKRNNTSSAWAALGTQDYFNNTISGGRLDVRVLNLTSFSDFGIGYGNSTLPITLCSFVAERIGDDAVKLKWSTSAELNNKLFVVERSYDGVEFEPINEQSGAGTSTELLHYNYTDHKPAAGFNYYRIRQIDYDGTFTLSPVRVIELKTQVPESQLTYTVYPNPSKGDFNIKLTGSLINDLEAMVRVYDIKGQLVREKTFTEGTTAKIDMNEFPQGTYITTVTDKYGRSTTQQVLISK